MTLEKILGGRDGGASHTDDGRLDVKLSAPGRGDIDVTITVT